MYVKTKHTGGGEQDGRDGDTVDEWLVSVQWWDVRQDHGQAMATEIQTLNGMGVGQVGSDRTDKASDYGSDWEPGWAQAVGECFFCKDNHSALAQGSE
ncbi:uncharacterized protein CTRU02_202906 [Colletotrichum truncatum]|uniref:Uncharacterized protein n=1 Tax=Colletotrichum truncatum TaxID=5467 RepID=A0ACC3ZLM7_COLTU